MSKYTKEERKFLDKAAIAYMQGAVSRQLHGITIGDIKDCFTVAKDLLTERKKLFGDE